jgi:hypothetical protein
VDPVAMKMVSLTFGNPMEVHGFCCLSNGGDVCYLGMGQNLVPLVNIKIAGKWMLIPLKLLFIGIDP